MKTHRIQYFIIIITIIALGIFSRQISVIPLSVGDILYAVMIYFIIRFLFLKPLINKIALIAITVCFSIELSQLFQAPWIITIRKTLIGHYVLGQGFLFSDLIAYSFGVFIASNFDYIKK